MIYDSELNILWEKKAKFPIVRCPYSDDEVAWIYNINGQEIAVRISEVVSNGR